MIHLNNGIKNNIQVLIIVFKCDNILKQNRRTTYTINLLNKMKAIFCFGFCISCLKLIFFSHKLPCYRTNLAY